jgi:hypothetical protein
MSWAEANATPATNAAVLSKSLLLIRMFLSFLVPRGAMDGASQRGEPEKQCAVPRTMFDLAHCALVANAVPLLKCICIGRRVPRRLNMSSVSALDPARLNKCEWHRIEWRQNSAC